MRCSILTWAIAVVALWLTPIARAQATELDLSRLRVAGDRVHAATPGGEAIELTLDPEIQSRLEALLERSRAPAGAIVMSDVKTGRVLAWASHGDARDLVRTPVYPGASVFKVVTAAALLEGGHAYRPTSLCYGGGVRSLSLADVSELCRPGEDRMPFGEALGHSINVIFGRLAVAHLGPAKLTETASALGLDGAVSFDGGAIHREITVPEDTLGLAKTAAGFSRDGVSPLGALFMMQAIANEGERVRLQIRNGRSPIQRIEDGRAVSAATANALVRMLEVTTRSGTSHEAFEDRPGRANVRVAGKTGTLAVRKPSRLVSWFAGFAPSRSPEVAVTVMLANEPSWWRKANDVARDALDAYFDVTRG
jgi:penicillin-binding protein A